MICGHANRRALQHRTNAGRHAAAGGARPLSIAKSMSQHSSDAIQQDLETDAFFLILGFSLYRTCRTSPFSSKNTCKKARTRPTPFEFLRPSEGLSTIAVERLDRFPALLLFSFDSISVAGRSVAGRLVVYAEGASAAGAATTSVTLVGSPCLPPCVLHQSRASRATEMGMERWFFSPATSRSECPTRPGARPPAACPPSDCGARHGRQSPGTGCSCSRTPIVSYMRFSCSHCPCPAIYFLRALSSDAAMSLRLSAHWESKALTSGQQLSTQTF